MLLACIAGLAAGILHVFSGPDHLAALAPLSLRARRRAWAVGLRWGLGHALGVLVVAAAAFALRWAVDLESLAWWGDRLVGATLILMGLWGFRCLFRRRLHAHVHEHDGHEHVHVHAHDPGERHDARTAHAHSHAALGVGALHGLAATGHLAGVLPGLALPSSAATAAYLACFAAGTAMSMTLFAGLVGWTAPGRGKRGLRLYRRAFAVASTACIALGTAWIIAP